jgi:cytochrome c5
MAQKETKYSPRVLMGSNGKPEGDEVYCCLTCHALVAEGGKQGHANWHERLRRAVDETGTLN